MGEKWVKNEYFVAKKKSNENKKKYEKILDQVIHLSIYLFFPLLYLILGEMDEKAFSAKGGEIWMKNKS